MTEKNNSTRTDSMYEGKDEAFMDIDRMTNEGLGGGMVTMDNGLIEASTTDTMHESESTIDKEES